MRQDFLKTLYFLKNSYIVFKTQKMFVSGSAGSDDYEIVLPRVVSGQNLTWAMVGPRYTVDKPVMLEILGPR